MSLLDEVQKKQGPDAAVKFRMRIGNDLGYSEHALFGRPFGNGAALRCARHSAFA